MRSELRRGCGCGVGIVPWPWSWLLGLSGEWAELNGVDMGWNKTLPL